MTDVRKGVLQTRTALPDAPSATALVEVRKRIAAVRDLRDGLVAIAGQLVAHPAKRGYLLLVDPRLGASCVDAELEGFRSAMLPEVAKRMHLLTVKGGEVAKAPAGIPDAEFRAMLRAAHADAHDPRAKLPPPDKQAEVLLVILHQWIQGQEPMTSRWLEDTVGCNYRTVAAAVERLGPAVKRLSDRRITLGFFPEEQWKRILANSRKTRSTLLYADSSDQPRSPESLVRRLAAFTRTDIAVGGVLGAKRLYPDLDIVGTPRLDLSIHAPGKAVDLAFVRKLDPALELTRDPHRPVRLALHFARREDPLFDREPNASCWSSAVDCLLDLYDARLEAQASAFAEYLVMRGEELSGCVR